MAASRKKASARKSPAPKPAVADDDEDEDDDEVEDATTQRVSAFFNPETHAFFCTVTHTVLTNEAHLELLAAKEKCDAADLARVQADGARAQTTYSGFSTNITFLQKQLEQSQSYADSRRDDADRWRSRASEVEMEMARMVRQSEDAKLERDRLAADLQRGQMQLQRLEMELAAKTQQRGMELDAVKEVSKPVFAVAAQGLTNLLMQYGKPVMGPGPGLPAAPAATNGASNGHAKAPEVDLYLENTEEFRAAFVAVYDKLQPRTIACLRALVCSQIPGAPAFPDHVKANLLTWLVEEAGDEAVAGLLAASRTAYVIEQPSVVTPAPNGAQAN